LAGFFGKFYLFSVAFRAGPDHGLAWLVALALFGSLISLYYYLMVLKVILVDRDESDHRPAAPKASEGGSQITVDLLPKLTVSALAGLVLLLGLLPQALAARILGCFP
jgi:NADH:ubiquinone oxidoreductase subunit 2 (subunit N)